MSKTRIRIGLIGLCLLGIYAMYAAPTKNIATLVNAPQKYAGQSVEIYIETKIDAIDDTGFWIRQGRNRLRVLGPSTGIKANDFVSISGIMDSSAVMHLKSVRPAKGRRLKMAISLLGLGLIFLLIITAVEWKDGTLRINENA